MQYLARKPGAWGMVAGIVVLVFLNVLGIIPLEIARGITTAASMLAAVGLVVALPMVMVVLLTRMLHRPRRRQPRRGWEAFPPSHTAIGVEPFTHISMDWTGPGPGMRLRRLPMELQ